MTADRPAWFAPKRYGYGAGLPIAWQGWAVLGAYLAVIGAVVWLNHMPDWRAQVAGFALAAVATAVLIRITARRTRGGWRWRWGQD